MEAEPQERPSGAGRVLGTFLGLALLLGAVYWTAQHFFVRPVDGAEKQAQYFGEKPLPFGLVLERAVRLPGSEVLVSFRRAGEASTGPSEVAFIEYASRSAVEPLFRSSSGGMEMGGGDGAGEQLKRWEKTKDFDWHTTMKRDEIAWGVWRSKLLIERAFEKQGTWKEEARVDLSQGERNLVLFAHWPAETPVDEKELAELLAAIAIPVQ